MTDILTVVIKMILNIAALLSFIVIVITVYAAFVGLFISVYEAVETGESKHRRKS